MAVMLRHIRLMEQYKGPQVAFREARKHCGWYMTGIRGAAALRRQAGTIGSMADAEALAQAAIDLYHGREPWEEDTI